MQQWRQHLFKDSNSTSGCNCKGGTADFDCEVVQQKDLHPLLQYTFLTLLFFGSLALWLFSNGCTFFELTLGSGTPFLALLSKMIGYRHGLSMLVLSSPGLFTGTGILDYRYLTTYRLFFVVNLYIDLEAEKGLCCHSRESNSTH